MPFTAPRLDDRNFQQIVDELKQRIPLYCPEWTDHNVSDPGVTLIELFAYMMEQVLYRMNQLPQLHYMKFAQFLGVPIPTPQPARAAVSFWLSKPRTVADDPDDQGQIIAEGTEVSTTQTETIAPIVFTTEKSAKIVAPRLSALVRHTRGNDPQFIQEESYSRDEWNVRLFSEQPFVHDAFYFEFDNDVSQHIISLQLDFAVAEATNINVKHPPVVWEVYTDKHQWETLQESDVNNTTKGFNAQGVVELHLPRLAKYNWRSSGKSTMSGAQSRYSIRVRVMRTEYDVSPHLLKIRQVATLGRVIETVHTQVEKWEYLGESNGLPGQRFHLVREPIILPLQPGEELWEGPLPQQANGTSANGQSDKNPGWKYVENFAYPEDEMSVAGTMNGHTNSAQAEAPAHFSIDVTTNEIRFGPAIKLPSGAMKLYGKVPKRGMPLYFTRYRYGGSTANVPSKTINVLKSSISYIARVENRRPAIGGQDMPSLDALELEVQRYLRFRKRSTLPKAIVNDDYRSLVLDRFYDKVAKVECHTTPELPDTIFVKVVAPIPIDILHVASLSETDLNVAELDLEEIGRYLHDFRLLTTRIRVENPRYVRIHIRISLAGDNDSVLQAQLEDRLTIYLHPLVGGDEGYGWPLQSRVSAQDLALWLQQQLGQIQIRQIQLQKELLQVEEGEAKLGTWTSEVTDLTWDQLIIPGRYEIG